jgi:hypothetical protein
VSAIDNILVLPDVVVSGLKEEFFTRRVLAGAGKVMRLREINQRAAAGGARRFRSDSYKCESQVLNLGTISSIFELLRAKTNC